MADRARVEHRDNVECQLFTPATRPAPVSQLVARACDEPPQLHIMDKYAPGCMAKFSNPDLFLQQFREEEERKQAELRAAKEERRKQQAARREASVAVCVLCVRVRCAMRGPCTEGGGGAGSTQHSRLTPLGVPPTPQTPPLQKHRARKNKRPREPKRPAADLNWRRNQGQQPSMRGLGRARQSAYVTQLLRAVEEWVVRRGWAARGLPRVPFVGGSSLPHLRGFVSPLATVTCLACPWIRTTVQCLGT